MTPALKDIGRITELLGVSPLAMSPLWKRPVDKITTQAIAALVARMSEAGQRDQVETAVDIALHEVKAAVERGEFAAPAMLEYNRPTRVYLTAGEMRNGLRYAQQPRAAAILFGLEANLNAVGVENLTWTQVARMQNQGALSALAEKCLLACPQQLRFKYVFWQHDGDGRVLQLAKLDHTVYEAFGMEWLELVNGYANLIRINEDADRKTIESYLRSE